MDLSPGAMGGAERRVAQRTLESESVKGFGLISLAHTNANSALRTGAVVNKQSHYFDTKQLQLRSQQKPTARRTSFLAIRTSQLRLPITS